MATLTGLQIDASYLGLIKTTDNAALTGTAKVLTDGAGNSLNMEVATGGVINFPSGTVDFTGSTVSGIPGALRAGSLTTDNFPNNFRNIATPGGTPSSSTAFGWESMAFGHGCTSQGARTVAIGIGSVAGGAGATGGAVSIGWAVSNTGTRSVGIGGDNVNRILATADDQVSIGSNIDNNNVNGIGIGSGHVINANGAVALGKNITAAKADTVSVTELETQLAGGGITMKSPNGTEYKLTVSDAGALVIT